jgi:hypothetical protein
MTDDHPLADDITEWDFATGEALEITSASKANLRYWHATGIVGPTPHWGGGSGHHKRWLFTDLVTAEIVWRLADEIGYDIDRLRGKDLGLNIQLAQAMFGWDLAVVLTPQEVSVRATSTVQGVIEQGLIDAVRPALTVVALVEPVATQLANTARSLRAETPI